MKAILFTLMLAGAIQAAGKDKVKELKVTSPAFSHNTLMPAKYSCEGENTSPPLLVSNMPANTKTLALIMHDPDAPVKGGYTHWVMWNINANGNLPEGYKDAMQGENSARQTAYAGMCPPSGTHHYNFKVYALDTQLDLEPQTDKAQLERAVKGHVLAAGTLTGLYKKTKK